MELNWSKQESDDAGPGRIQIWEVLSKADLVYDLYLQVNAQASKYAALRFLDIQIAHADFFLGKGRPTRGSWRKS
jgi:hypothetical protein